MTLALLALSLAVCDVFLGAEVVDAALHDWCWSIRARTARAVSE